MRKYLVLLIVCSLFVSCGMAKKSDAYKEALAFLKQHTQAVNLLGEISDDTSMTSFHLQAAPAEAEFTMTVHGTKQSGQYMVKLNKDTGVWKPIVATLSTDNHVVLNLLTVTKAAEFRIQKDYFGTQEFGPEVSPPVFPIGQTIYYNVYIEGLRQRDDGKAVIEADQSAENSAGEEVLRKEKILTGDVELDNGILPLYFSITSGPAVPTGAYTTRVIIRDMLSGKQLTSSRKFEFIEAK